MRALPLLFLLACTGSSDDTDATDTDTDTSSGEPDWVLTIEHIGPIYEFKETGAFPMEGTSTSYRLDNIGIGDQVELMFTVADQPGLVLYGQFEAYDDRTPLVSTSVTEHFEWRDISGDTVTAAQGVPAVDTLVQASVNYIDDLGFPVTVSLYQGAEIDGTPVDLHDGIYAVSNLGSDTLLPLDEALRSDLETYRTSGDPSAFLAEDHSGITTPLAHPFVLVTRDGVETPLFDLGEPDFGEGLEALAEDGNPEDLLATWDGHADAVWVGSVDNPDGTYENRPIMPGESFVVEGYGDPTDRLHVAWMFVQSNDSFFALDQNGVSLEDTGDISTNLWINDAGTEVNEPMGWGPTQAPRQDGSNSGEDESGVVDHVDDSADDWPEAMEVVRVTLEAL